MMGGRKVKQYQVYSGTNIIHIARDKTVTLQNNISLKVSFILVLIGSSPDLSFLSSPSVGTCKLSVTAAGRDNHIEIDPYTHESTIVPGLYAMGPLTGDNFVRFIQGGALAITAHIAQKN